MAFCVTRNATDCHVFVGMVRQVKGSSNWFGYIFKIHIVRMIVETLDVEPVKIGYAFTNMPMSPADFKR